MYTATTEIYTYCHTLSLPYALPSFAPADGQQIGHFGQAVFAQLVVDLLGAEVGFRPDSRGAQLFRHLACIAVRIGHDGRHHRLHRRQPERETARIMFDEDAVEPLVGDRKSTRLNSSH